MNAQDKKASLVKYVESLKQKLQSQTPDKHKNRETGYRKFLYIDLKKTLAKIEKL